MKKLFQMASMMLVALSMSATFVACDKNDEPTPAPKQEEEQHEHEEEIAKAVFTMAVGHFHGTLFHQDADPTNVKYVKSVQTITYVNNDGKWELEAGSDSVFRVTSLDPGLQADNAYGLWITYLDKEGNTINGDFIENGADAEHQHFFIPRDVKPTFDGQAEADDSDRSKIFSYVYMDTNPWNKTLKDGASLVGSERVNGVFTPKNPIGFKGFFTFLKARKTFNIEVALMHSATGKAQNGTLAPFYRPWPTASFDHNINIPVICYATREDRSEFDIDETETYEALSDAGKAYVLAVSKAYGITIEQAFDDIMLWVNGTRDTESGSLWF